MNPILAADFKLPDDGLYQIAPEGEFVHLPTGFRQQLDADACQAIVADFTARAAAPGFPGLLVDYDHESLDMAKRTEAAGWILALEHRPGAGLWGRIRWTDAGEAAVRGGRYRFLSPVWKQEDCEPLGEGRLRPRRLLNAALTNNPNLKDMAPLSNAAKIRATPQTAALIANRALANALIPGNERQRRAVFAKLRGAPMGATPLSSEELDAADAAQAKADEEDRQRRLELAKIIARRKAIEADKARPKPYTSAAAEALERGIQHARKVQVKKQAAKVQQPAARAGGGRTRRSSGASTPQTVAQLPRAYVRPTTDRLPGGVGLQWRHAPAQTAAGRNAPRLKPGESIYDYFARNYANRALPNAGRPMRPAQRRALWAMYALPIYARSRVRAIRQALTPTPTAAAPADAAPEDVAAGLARLLATPPLANADRFRSDEERRAMFAKMRSGDRDAGRAYIDDAEARTTQTLKDLGVWGTLPGGGAPSAKFLASGIKGAVPKIAAAVKQIAPEVQSQIMALRERIAQWEEYAAPGAARAIAKAKKTIGIMERQGVDQGVAESIASDVSAAATKARNAAAELADSVRITDPAEIARLNALHGVNVRPPSTLPPTGPRPSKYNWESPEPSYFQWYEWGGKPHATPLSEADALQYMREHGIPNRGQPMSDEERRAMFAKMNQRGRTAAAPAPSPSGAMSDPPSADTAAGPFVSHTPTRDSPARIEQLYAEQKAVEAAAPQRPHPPASLELKDTRALRDDLMRQGRNSGDILRSIADAEEHNRAAAAEVEGMKVALKARGVAPDRIPAELQKQLDRRQEDYDKQVADWEKASARNAAALAAIDKKIAAEQIRMKEDWAKSDQARANDEVRRLIAQDKARAAAELTARRKAEADAARAAKATASVKPADPLAENTAIKRRNKAYAEAIVRGDLDLAEKLAPGLDHNRNRQTVTALLPEPGAPLSPRNSKALAELLRALERTNPIDYPRR